MGKLFIIIGKSASGKDTIYKQLLLDEELNLKKVVTYTTRPVRDGEKEGEEYHFVDEKQMKAYEEKGVIAEKRSYDTVHGIWNYFTVDDGNINLKEKDQNYVMIGTLEVLTELRKYFGSDSVEALYIELEDGERLSRALERERENSNPKYSELCRRYLADADDFSEKKLANAEIKIRFDNSDFDDCYNAMKKYIMRVTKTV